MILPVAEGTSMVRNGLVLEAVWECGPLSAQSVVPGAGLEPATFGCLRHRKGFARHTIAVKAAL